MSDRFSPSNASDRAGQIRRPQPLSQEFSDADRMLDARLADLAEQAPVPPGLAGRVFAASRPLLCNAEHAPAASARLRFPGHAGRATLRLTRRVGARFATAAAVGLLAVVTWWSTWQGAAPPSGTREAVVSPPSTLETRDVAWHAADALDAAYQRISTYIVAAEDIHSAADVETELVGLFPELMPGNAVLPSSGR